MAASSSPKSVAIAILATATLLLVGAPAFAQIDDAQIAAIVVTAN